VSNWTCRQTSSLRHALRAALGAVATLREARDELRIERILWSEFFNPARPTIRACVPCFDSLGATTRRACS
jgi:hypothetical protein